MRHIVLYDRWSSKNEPQLKGGIRERQVEAEGWFHCWRQDGSEPVAVVELDDGHVETWIASLVGFDRVERGTTNIVVLQEERDVLRAERDALLDQMGDLRKALEAIAGGGEALRSPAEIASDALAELLGTGASSGESG